MTIKTCLACVTLLAACGKKKEEQIEPPVPQTPPPADASAGSGSAGSAAEAPKPIVIKDAGFMTPESVLYDADADIYLVANINGQPNQADDNGFISRVSPDGKVAELKWIDGTKPDVKLDAPKGMAISGGILWVADITAVRKFDAKTGKPAGEIKVPGSVFLNDITPDGKDGIYVTDTSLNDKFEVTGADAIYQIDKANKLTTFRKGKDLGGPNGITMSGEHIIVVTFGTGEVLRVPAKGDLLRAKPPTGKLDGVISLGGDEYFVSSWEGKTVYRGKVFADNKPEGTWTNLELDIEGPADIGYDTKRKRLLVPHFMGNAISLIDQ